MTYASQSEAKKQPARSGVTAPKQTYATQSEVRKRQARTRVTNGTDILPGVDQRSVVARRYRDIVAAVVSDQGGLDRLAEARVQLIRRFAAAAVMAEQAEAQLASGGDISIADHALLCSTLVRIAQRIGINRRAREVLPTLSTYLEAKAGDGEEEDEATDDVKEESNG